MKILFIDDEESIVKVFKNIFTLKGYEVDTSTTIKGALNLLENDYDYIVVDFYMEDICTIDLIEEMLKKYDKNNICVLSGLEDEKEIEKLTKIGVVKFLKKPATYKQILEILL